MLFWNTEGVDITYDPPPPETKSQVHRLYILFALALLLIVAFILGSSSQHSFKTQAATNQPTTVEVTSQPGS